MIYAILVVTGLAFGSFVNALVWRLKMHKDWVKERSVCVHCGHVLSAADLVPVLSWLQLRGKCRYCHNAISIQYPLVELATTTLFVLSYALWPTELVGSAHSLLPFIVWLIALIGLVAIVVFDFRWMIIPDSIVIPLTVLAIALIVVESTFLHGGTDVIKDAVVGLVIGGGFFYAILELSKGKWIGGGDVKLGFALGLLLGARDAFIALYAASLLGLLVMVVGMATKRISRKSKIPFGPFLIAGAILAKFFGKAIWQWYSRKLGA